MTANLVDEKRREAQRKIDRARQQRAKPRRGLVAEQLVNDWSPAQRARIRAILLQLRWFSGRGGEMAVVELIDQASEGV